MRPQPAPALLALVLTACGGGGGGAAPVPSKSVIQIATEACPAGAELLTVAEQQAVEGERLPDLSFPCLGHPGSVRMRALGGRLPVVLNVWASWCRQCRTEMPEFEQVHQAMLGKVRFLGVNTRDVDGPARRTIQFTGISYASVVDPDGELRTELRALGMPVTVIVNREGQVVFTRLGEMTGEQLRTAIKSSLGIS